MSFLYAEYNEFSVGKIYKARVDNFMKMYYQNKNYLVDLSVFFNDSNRYLSLNLYLDKKQFFDQDIDFIKSVIVSQTGFDITNGNKIFLHRILFKKDILSQNWNFNENNYIFIILIFGIILIGIIFFIIYIITLNKKINRLILNQIEMAKKNILVQPLEKDIVNIEKENDEVNKNIEESSALEKTDLEIAEVSYEFLEENLESSDSGYKENNLEDKSSSEKFGNIAKIDFLDLGKVSSRLLNILLKKYNSQILATAIFKTKEEFQNKILNSLNYSDKQNLIFELSKLEKLNNISAETILKVRENIEKEINEYIVNFKIELNKFM